jgi:WD domain, G-beta repeat
LPGITPPPEWSTWPRSALVIATSAYNDGAFDQLRAPVHDADKLSTVLGDPRIGGFAVTVLTDRPVDRLRRETESFLAGRSREELLVVYLSCHGILDKRNVLHFVAVDTSKELLASTGIEAQWLLKRLDDCDARQQVLILDCCFSGAVFEGAKGEGDLDLKQHVTGSGRGRMVLTASRAREYSFEGRALSDSGPPGSVFTSGLVEGLRTGDADGDRDGLVSVEDAYDYAYTYVQIHRSAQTPQRWAFGVEGRIMLARNPTMGQPTLDSPKETGPAAPVRIIWRWRRRHFVAALGCVAAAGAVTAGLVLTAPSRTAGLAPNAPSHTAGLVPTAPSHTAGPVPTAPSHAAFTTAKITATLPDPNTSQPNVGAVAFAPDGTTLATSDGLGNTYLWSISTGKIAATLTDPNNAASTGAGALNFAPHGTTLATTGGNSGDIYLWNTTTRKITATLTGPTDDGSGVSAPAFAPDGTTLACGDGEGSTYLWSTTTGKLITTLTTPGSHAAVDAVAFAPDGTTLAIGENDGNTYLWNTTTRKITATLSDPTNNDPPHGAVVDAVAFAPDGATLAIADDYGFTYLWNTAARKPAATLLNPNDSSVVDTVAFAPDGDTLATSTVEGNAYLWDTTTGKLTATLADPVSPNPEANSQGVPVAFAPDGKTLAIGGNGNAWLWHISE